LSASRSWSADGNETWLTRFLPAAIARPSKEAIRRASAFDEGVKLRIRKSPIDVSVALCGVAVEVLRAEDDFEGAATEDQMGEALGTTAAGMHANPDFGLA
jgi:hypothetical protein